MTVKRTTGTGPRFAAAAVTFALGAALFASAAVPETAHSKESEKTSRHGGYIHVPHNYVHGTSVNAGSLARVSVLVDGRRAEVYRHDGEYFVEGRDGSVYTLMVTNRRGGRIKAVMSVDGLDVIDGTAKSGYGDRLGYIVGGYSSANIRGWRISDEKVAEFRFGPVSESYAMKTDRPSNIGVIEFAIFRERERYAEPPVYIDRGASEKNEDVKWRKTSDTGAAAKENRASESERAPGAPAAESRSDKAGCFPEPPTRRPVPQSLGTEFGDDRHSSVRRVDFEARTSYPEEIVRIRYASREDLVRRGVFGGGIEIIDDNPPDHPVYPDDTPYCRPPESWRK